MATDKLDESGLRYLTKSTGSPYTSPTLGGNTMSCLRCGRHKPRSQGRTVRILGAPQFICGDCKPPGASQKA